MTDDEVRALYSTKGSKSFDPDTVCAKCNRYWSRHYTVLCSPGKVFNPAAVAPTNPLPTTYASYDAQSTIDLFDELMKVFQKNPQKKYTIECPCGIHPDQCTYHRS